MFDHTMNIFIKIFVDLDARSRSIKKPLQSLIVAVLSLFKARSNLRAGFPTRNRTSVGIQNLTNEV